MSLPAFAEGAPLLELFVPGRICLFGEHSDWAGGYRKYNPSIEKGQCIVSGINQGLHAKIGAHADKLIVRSVDHNGKLFEPIFETTMNLHELRSIASKGDLFSYIAGVAYEILLRFNVGGLIVDNYKTTLPLKKGLSSSAAVCVLIARAFNKIYNLNLTIEGEMDLAYLGERTTPSQCGPMDQCVAFGQKPMIMSCDGDLVEWTELNCGAPLYLIIVDLCSSKDTQIILKELNDCYDNNNNNSSDIAKGVRMLFGQINLDITNRAIKYIKQGNVKMLGSLMSEAQSYFDKYAMPACPSQLKSPILHKVLNYSKIENMIYGGKGIGSQGDGSCQLLCRSAKEMEKVAAIIETDLGMPCLCITIGSHQTIRKAVIPCASIFGGAMFPANKACSSALFPIVDTDGYAKPAILILVEMAINAGITDIYIIVSKNDYSEFRTLFYDNIDLQDYERLSPKKQQYHQNIIQWGKSIHLVIQSSLEGLGHAIYQCKAQLNKDAFLLMLGDHIYRSLSKKKESCVQQLLSHYNGNNLVGLKWTNEELIGNYGTIAGRWIMDKKSNGNGNGNNGNGQRLIVGQIFEKPSIEYARKHLQILNPRRTKVNNNNNENEYLTMFGLYILDNRLMSILHDNITCNRRTNGKFELTNALETLRKEQNLEGYIVNGERFDIGASPQSYVETLANFSKSKL